MSKSRRQILTGLGAAGVAAGAIYTKNAVKAEEKNPVAPEPTSQSPGAKFADKVVLITGATSGIGEETAKSFAQQGAKVFFCGRRENLGKRVEQQIRDAGGEATYMKADVRKAEEVKAFVDVCVAKYGQLDIAFNNAGVDYPPQPIADTKVEEFDDLMNTNARGVFLGMKYQIPYMLKAGSGAIINMASIGG
ncbi:MAG: SDR family NAD(P)-dependent oxidoreductase, partial [Cyanobacteriota bacterium]|nr:SDR family NAD(P)-dependent oxidoreductase [Cyanobacteriota bacterium]